MAFAFGKHCPLAEMTDQIKAPTKRYDIFEEEKAQEAHVPHTVNSGHGNNRTGGGQKHGAGCEEDDNSDQPS